MGLLLSTDRSTSFLTRLYVSKSKSYEFIFAYALSIIPIVFVQSILFFVVGMIFDFSIFSINMLYAILLSLFTSLFYIVVGLFIGCLCSEKSMGGVASIVIAGQSVLSGMWFPIEGLNDTILTIMNILPFRNATILVQNAMLGSTSNFKDFLLPLIIVLAYTTFAFICAIITFTIKMKEK